MSVLLDIERFQKEHFETVNNWRTWREKGMDSNVYSHYDNISA